MPANLVVGKAYEIELIRTPGTNLDALADVAISNPVDGELLQYDVLNGWRNIIVVTPMANFAWSGSNALTLTDQNTWYPIEWAGFTFISNTKRIGLQVELILQDCN